MHTVCKPNVGERTKGNAINIAWQGDQRQGTSERSWILKNLQFSRHIEGEVRKPQAGV